MPDAPGGISAISPGNLLRLHKGYFEVNGTALGARPDEDVTIAVNVVSDYPDLAGAIDRVRGTGAVVEASGSLQGSLTEFSYAVLSITLGDIGYDSSGSSNKIGGQTVGTSHELAQVKYTGVNKADGKAVSVTIPYATCKVESLAGGNSPVVYQVTFETLVDPSTPTTYGMYIEIQK
jgi:hypothetical protein